MEVDYSVFQKYSPSSNELTLHYKLDKYIPNSKHFEPINLDAYGDELSSIVNKDKFSGYITVSKNISLKQFKKNISEITGFPIDTMVGFGIWGGNECDENGEEWTIVNPINIDENTLISNTCYNDKTIQKRYIYIFIDINKNQIFSSVNDNQIKNEKNLMK